MINVLYGNPDYQINPKQLEVFDKYCSIIQWGRRNPTRFMEQFFNLQFTDTQKYVLLSSWVPAVVVILASRDSGKSFLSAPFIMARTVLYPSHNTYIMAPTGGQAQETFTKLENLAKDNIASVVGVSSFFLDECFRINSKADPFTHDKNSYTVSTFNGSTINTLNSVAKNIVGIRSNFNVYDEGGKIDRDFYALTQPFTAQNTDFIVGTGIDADIYPRQLPNKTMYLSSAEGVDSEMFDQYKLCFEKMLMGDPNYFVCDLDCTHSIHPFMNGKPMKPLVTQEHVDNAMKVNPYKATREYYNKWDNDGGNNVLVKRSVINRNSQAYYPIYENDGQHKYIITYDPSSKLDNSEVLVSEIFRDEEKGLMLKLVNMVNMIELLKSGEKVIKQKPEQIEDIKQMILDYNKGYIEYEGLEKVIFDAGAGGGGFEISQFLLDDWKDSRGKLHRGLIDPLDKYMELRVDDYPGAWDGLLLFNFKSDKVTAYQRLQDACNQGLIIFPKDLNTRAEIEFEEVDEEGNLNIRHEKVDRQELQTLTEMSLLKEELVGMEKITKQNGTIQFDLSPEAKSSNKHDDRADVCAMAAYWLMELRAKEATMMEEKSEDFSVLFAKYKSKNHNKNNNPFTQRMNNPFFTGRRMF